MDIDLGAELGAAGEPSAQRLTLYIPNKDCAGVVVPDHQEWATRAQELLTRIGNGATAFPPVRGTWQKPDGGVLWEETTIMYTYIDADKMEENLGRLREFLHAFGRETNQGEVVFEFDGWFFRLNAYDEGR